MTLPPEILDKILEHIPTDKHGRPTLISCALVATWWTGPSQRRLFSSVSVDNENYHRWMDGVALFGSKRHLLQYVRSLQLGPGVEYPMQGLPKDPGEYFSALHNIHSLELVDVKINKAEFDICFSAFRETLTNLDLGILTMPFGAFVALVDYFPNIVTLQLSPPTLEPDEGSVPPLSRPLRGKLRVDYAVCDYSEFIDRFATLDLEYEELVISSWYCLSTRSMESSLQLSPDTVKYLRLLLQPRCEYPSCSPSSLRVLTQPLTSGETIAAIHHFRQLRELELRAVWPNSVHETLLSSITSTELRKIILSVRHVYQWNTLDQQMEEWDGIDEQLCELVARLGRMGHHHTLEVELRFTEAVVGLTGCDFTNLLPKFRKTGVVNIINPDIIYSDSDLRLFSLLSSGLGTG